MYFSPKREGNHEFTIVGNELTIDGYYHEFEFLSDTMKIYQPWVDSFQAYFVPM